MRLAGRRRHPESHQLQVGILEWRDTLARLHFDPCIQPRKKCLTVFLNHMHPMGKQQQCQILRIARAQRDTRTDASHLFVQCLQVIAVACAQRRQCVAIATIGQRQTNPNVVFHAAQSRHRGFQRNAQLLRQRIAQHQRLLQSGMAVWHSLLCRGTTR